MTRDLKTRKMGSPDGYVYDKKVNKLDPLMIEEGWRQTRAGVALIDWSKLASWDAKSLTLIPAQETVFESHHREVHSEFGRLLCWIAFGVGGEYLAKGACILNKHDLRQDPAHPIRLPQQGENIEEWIRLVNANDKTVRESGFRFPTLGELTSVRKIPSLKLEQDLVSASFRLLASAIRNRDAHCYAPDVRGYHFDVVRSLFAPAFNILLASLNKKQLRARLSKFRLDDSLLTRVRPICT